MNKDIKTPIFLDQKDLSEIDEILDVQQYQKVEVIGLNDIPVEMKLPGLNICRCSKCRIGKCCICCSLMSKSYIETEFGLLEGHVKYNCVSAINPDYLSQSLIEIESNVANKSDQSSQSDDDSNQLNHALSEVLTSLSLFFLNSN